MRQEKNHFFDQKKDAEVTVIITHYNCPDLLVKALTSIENQTVKNWCCIIVDDYSHDLEAIIKLQSRFDNDKFLWLRTDKNVGQFRIYNKLIPLIETPYIMMQDADDWADSTRIEKLLEAFQSGTWDILGSAAIKVNEQGEKVGGFSPPVNLNLHLRWWYRRGVFLGATLMAKTNFLKQLRAYDGTTKIAGDSDLIYRAVFKGRIGNLSRPLYFYTVRPESLTQSNLTGFNSEIRNRYIRKMKKLFYQNILLRIFFMRRKMNLLGSENDISFNLNSVKIEN